jgi:HSP90 family molecular chaperone
VAVERAFQVDLRAAVDLLSHHLYSSPRVYLRELLQNAAEAITARRLADPAAPAVISVEPPALTGDGTLRIHDSGIGLTEPEVHELLATIGRSSSRERVDSPSGVDQAGSPETITIWRVTATRPGYGFLTRPLRPFPIIRADKDALLLA